MNQVEATRRRAIARRPPADVLVGQLDTELLHGVLSVVFPIRAVVSPDCVAVLTTKLILMQYKNI